MVRHLSVPPPCQNSAAIQLEHLAGGVGKIVMEETNEGGDALAGVETTETVRGQNFRTAGFRELAVTNRSLDFVKEIVASA